MQSQGNLVKAIPAVVYGTAWKKQNTASLVCLALKAGFRGVDTACQPKHYNEAGVGEGIKLSGVDREQLFIQTKFTPIGGQDPSNVPYNPSSPLKEQVTTSLSASLKNLKTHYLDALLLHSPMGSLQKTIEVWQCFEGFVGEGKVVALGISNCYDYSFFVQLYERVKIKPRYLQNRFYAQSGYDAKLRAFCRERGVVYQSFWTLTANPHILQSKEVRSLSSKYKKTEAQIFYSVLMGEGIVPLIGTTSQKHMREDLQVVGWQMEEAERQSVLLLCK